MNKLFYVAVNGQQHGPYTIEELRAQRITRDTMVWTEGQSDWRMAGQVDELRDIVLAAPPPLKSQSAPPPLAMSRQARQQEIEAEKYFGYKLAPIGTRFGAMFVSGIITIIPAVLVFLAITNNNYDYPEGDIFSPNSMQENFIFIGVEVLLALIFYPAFGGNMGHAMFGLQVISANDGTVQKNAGMGALREGLKGLFGFVLIPIIWLLWDENRQNLYDKVTQTYVVLKNSNPKEQIL
jgi:uncharacterized RDD family membrane protein YckC